jgi:hypothetical protein
MLNSLAGALGEIRTPDPRIRSPMLYPAELRALGLSVIRLARTEPAVADAGQRIVSIRAFVENPVRAKVQKQGYRPPCAR